jgi:hypothetical protein
VVNCDVVKQLRQECRMTQRTGHFVHMKRRHSIDVEYLTLHSTVTCSM